MKWPDTGVGATGAAGFEASSAVGHLSGQESSAVGGLTAPVVFASIPQRPDLPCSANPELFFAEAPSDVEDAKALCRDCPVRLTCFAGALERREPWGVWGGELFLRGEVVPRKRPRGRPRKTEVAA